MSLHKLLVALLLSSICSTGSASSVAQQLQRPKDWYAPESHSGAIQRRQTPIVIAPPRTSLAPQPTSSLNYWWPYGPNGANPTVTSMIALPSGTNAVDDADTIEETSTEGEASSTTDTPSSSSHSSSSITFSTTTLEASALPTESIVETPDAKGSAFKVISLLPLFIIMGVLIIATVVGWTYGRCVSWCRRQHDPMPGGPNIGGKPYESSRDNSDPMRTMHSLGLGWVDASRIHGQDNLGTRGYHAIQMDPSNEGFGKPSKGKHHTQGGLSWFRYTSSGRKHPFNSPSGEKRFSLPFPRRETYARLPADNLGPASQYSTSSWKSRSPRLLRVINGSPSTLGTEAGVRSPATSAQPTPRLSASRHASIRRKILKKAQVYEEEDLLAASALIGVFQGFDGEEHEDDWTAFKGELKKHCPPRTYSLTSPDSQSPSWSRDPEVHRTRMHRLRSAAQSARSGSAPMSSASNSDNVTHPLPPTPEVLLSPPLQPHLFFTDSIHSSDQSVMSPKATTSPFVRSSVGWNLSSRRSAESHSSENDPFGPCVPLVPASTHTRRGRARYQGALGSTETLPLSPELRGAAMNRLDEIMKTSWSMRNLAGTPRSPTLYGALGPPLGHRTHANPRSCDSGIEEFANRSGGER